MKQTYEQRVRALAETMYRDEAGIKKDSGINKVDWALFGERYMQYARIAVAETAEAAKRGYNQGVFDVVSELYPGLINSELYIKEQGLIPDNAPDILPMQPGEPGHGGYNPDNPPPDNLKAIDDAINLGDGFVKKAVPDNAQEGGSDDTK